MARPIRSVSDAKRGDSRDDVGSDSAVPAASNLDPADWATIRALGHCMLDDVFDALGSVADGPVWRPMPDDVRAAWTGAIPRGPTEAGEVYSRYRRMVAPYGVGNRHPRFFGWVHGGGNAIGMLAEMLAAGLNANCGGRDHAPILVERQVIRWAAEMLGFPVASSGLLVTGTSIANLVAVLVARSTALGPNRGVGGERLVAYASDTAHMCIARALDMAGIGASALRSVPSDVQGRMQISELAKRITADRAAGFRPFLVVGTAGTVNTGAIDPLEALSGCCRENGVWFHVDGAFGALAMLSPRLRPVL